MNKTYRHKRTGAVVMTNCTIKGDWELVGPKKKTETVVPEPIVEEEPKPKRTRKKKTDE